ncbi:MAG TPA: hypothetical protein VF720_08670 [Candidatus Eisenbacteria bacterium]
MEWNRTSSGVENSPTTPTIHVDELREIIRESIDEALGLSDIRLAPRWQAGTVILKPGDPSLKEKEIPLEVFFHKIVMVRDRLRVLEQKINAHKTLGDADKVEMQQYVTKIYGTLTSFNVLFRDRDDQFVGERGGRDDD